MGQRHRRRMWGMAAVLGAAVLTSSGSAFAWSVKNSCRYDHHGHGKGGGFHATYVFGDSPYSSPWSHSPYIRSHYRYAHKRHHHSHKKLVVVNHPVTRAYSDTVVINIPNPNGSYTPVTLRRSGGTYIGPRGEHYDREPTIEQLQALYGLE